MSCRRSPEIDPSWLGKGIWVRPSCLLIGGEQVIPDALLPPTSTFAQEYVNGQLKNKYGDAFIRGNNGGRVPFLWALTGG